MVEQQNFSEIGITDDFMFATVFKQNKAACKRLLESILGFEISKLEYVNDQESISTYKSSHSIRLDIVARDNGAIYDIEMQKLNRGDIIKRSRYYQSQIDVAEFLKGKNYKKLKDSYIIFICMFDLFGLDAVDLARSDYYYWKASADKRAEREEKDLESLLFVKEAFNACKYHKQGARSIRMVLHRDYYINYSRKRIRRIMKKYSIV